MLLLVQWQMNRIKILCLESLCLEITVFFLFCLVSILNNATQVNDESYKVFIVNWIISL